MSNSETALNRIGENTYSALKSLVDNSYYVREGFQHQFNVDIEGSYQRDYCTVQLAATRRSGHSTAIVRLTLEYFRKALILYPNLQMAERMRDVFRSYEGEGIRKCSRGRIEMHDGSLYLLDTVQARLTEKDIQMNDIEAIIVDCATLLSDIKRDLIYEIGSRCMSSVPQKIFIFVG